MIVSVSPHTFSWLCQFLNISFRDCVSFSIKLTQSWKLMWRNWHNHKNLCGETDTITKTYAEKLTQSWKLMFFMIVSVSPHKFSWLCQFLHISFHDCVSFSTYVFVIVSVSPQRKLMWRNWHNNENVCGATDTIMKTCVEKLTQSLKLM
jgi:hypothetical protein